LVIFKYRDEFVNNIYEIKKLTIKKKQFLCYDDNSMN